MAGRRRPGAGEEKSADGSGAATDASRIRSCVLGLLARREHSTGELGRKLASRGFDAAATGIVLDELGRKGLLSDERYGAGFIHHHSARGQGPARIRAGLREAQVAPELIDRLLDQAEVDWVEAARNVQRKKFRTRPRTFAERAKQARFLQYRGFSQDQIRATFGAAAGDFDPDVPGSDD